MKQIYLYSMSFVLMATAGLMTYKFASTLLQKTNNNHYTTSSLTFTELDFYTTQANTTVGNPDGNCTEQHTGEQKIIADLIMEMDGHATSNDIHNRMSEMGMMPEGGGCEEASVIMVDLRGSPNFAQPDYLVTCGAPDTLAILMYTSAPNPISGLTFTIDLPKGLEYGGFVETKNAGIIQELNVSDAENPVFLIPELTQEEFIVAYIGVKANCEGSTSASSYFIDYQLDYNYTDSDGLNVNCRDEYTPNTEYNNAVKVPVLNTLSVNPSHMNFMRLDNLGAQLIEISQDGLDSYLEEFTFKVHDLDTSVGIEIVNVVVNNVVGAPYTYDANTNELTATISGDLFLHNIDPLNRPADDKFDTSERIRIYVYYRMPECHSTPLQNISYSSSYSCNGTACQSPSFRPASFEQNPTFNVQLNANATLVQAGGFCGDNVIIDLDVAGTDDDPVMGLIEDMKVSLATCGSDNVAVSQLTIGNTIMPPNTYGINGGFIELYLTEITTDPDGDGIGLEDIDNDGRFDDLPGGNTIDAQIELMLLCPSSPGTCAASGCNINQITANGLVNCGEDEVALTDNISPAVTFQYQSASNFPNEVQIRPGTNGYNFGTFSTGAPSTQTIQVCYTATAENLQVCSGGTARMEVALKGRSHEVFDAEMSNVSFEGSNVSNANVNVVDDEDVNTRTFVINAGNSANNQEFCYEFNMTFDTCVCAPPTYLSLEAVIIEECGSDCACQLTKGCAKTLFYTDPYCTGCSCSMATTADVSRASTGYTDKSMETKLSPNEVATEDRARFMPGDTAIITSDHVVLNAEDVNSANYLFNFVIQNRRVDYAEAALGTAGMKALVDGPAMQLLKMEYIPVSTGIPVDLRDMICTLDDSSKVNRGMYVYGPHLSYKSGACPIQPAFPDIEETYNVGQGSGDDSFDQYLLGTYLYNFDDTNHPNVSLAGDCVTPLFEAIGGSFADGDIIRTTFSVPLIKNPIYDPSQDVQQVFVTYVNGYAWDNNAQTSIYVANNCWTPQPYDFHIPELDVQNRIEVTDCGAEVIHDFSIQNPPPADWYQNEYRPILGLSQMESNIPAPLIYSGGATVTNGNGDSSPLSVDEFKNDPIYANYNGDDFYTPDGAMGNVMTLNFQDSEYKNGVTNLYTCDEIDDKRSGGSLPLVGVGLGNDDIVSIRIPVEKLCADPIDPTILNIDYDYSFLYLPDLNHVNFFCHGQGNVDRGICDTDDPAANRFYFAEYTRDSDTNPHFHTETSNVYQVIDNSTAFPTLTATISRPSLVDLFNASESNTFTLCAGSDGGATHQNVIASITVPNSVEFINVTDGTSDLPYMLAKTTDSTKVYGVSLADIAPNECATLVIETEQLFCGGEPNDSKVCVAASSGCLAPEKAAAILGQADGGSCSSANACYFYDVKESGVQAEAVKSPITRSTLCSEIELAIRVKNVKASQLNQLMTNWWLPEGLIPIENSWEFSYPNGPNVQEAFISIPDAVRNPSADGILGAAYTYLDDKDFSDYIDANGLAGISTATAVSDSNQFVIRFKALTTCEEFTSGSKMYFEVNGGGSCEALVSSGAAISNDIIIEDADPKDFAQILTIVDPVEVNCGGVLPLGITGLNISENGGTTMNTRMTVILPEGFSFSGTSVNFTSPSDFTPTSFTTEELGNGTKLVFDLPDGIEPDGFFKFDIPVTIEESLGCGSLDLLIDAASFIPAVACSSGEDCGVYVRNSVNEFAPVTIRPPLNYTDLEVVSLCEDDPNNVDLEYTFNLDNPGVATYNDIVTVELIQDLNGNLIADDFEPALATAIENVNLAPGEASMHTGMFTVPEAGSCPSILKLTYETTCACNSDEILMEQIEPKFFSALGDKTVLCPDENLVFPTCGAFTYELSPANAGTISIENDEVTVDLADGFGTVTPVFLNLTGSHAQCDLNFSQPIYQIENFEIGPYDPHVVCEEGCSRLNLKLPGSWEGNVTILWEPATYLDDPTSSTPELCDPLADITYTVTVTNPEGGCTTTADYPVVIDPTTINSVMASDCRYVELGTSVSDVTVSVSWATPAIAGDIINVSIGEVVQTIDPHTTTQPAEVILTVPASGTTEQVLVNYSKNPSCQDALSVNLPAPCHAALGNYVWEDEDYDGMQDDNEPPVEGVKVTLYECNGGTKGAMLDMTETDENGEYLFEGLEAGEYCVHFDLSTAEHGSAEDLVFTQNDHTGEDALDSDANPTDGCTTSVTLTAGQENRDLDAGVYVPSKIGDFVWDDLNNNGVQDADEPGIAGAEVTLTYFDQNGNEIDTTITTGPNGEYCFTDLVPGDYKVTFGQPNGTLPTNANTGDDTTDSDANPDNMLMSEIVTLTSGDIIPTIDAGFFTPVSVGDKTFIDTNYNGIQDADDLPLEGVTITLYSCQNNQPVTEDAEGNPITSILSDENGMYTFDNLPPGDYYVVFDVSTVEGDDHFEITQENAGDDSQLDSDVDANGQSDKTGFLESGDENNSLDAGFYIPAKLGDFVWDDLNNNGVQDADEPGIAGAEVTLTYFDQNGNEIDTTVTTGSNGEYCFPDLVPGDYKVTFSQPNGTLPTNANTGDDATDSDADPDNMLMSEIVTLTSGDTIPTIDGGFFTPVSVGDKTFVDTNYNGIQDADDLPLAGVTITLYNCATGQTVTEDAEGNPILPIQSDANGMYSFDNLPPGDYYVVFDTSTADNGDQYQITQENIGEDAELDSDINTDGQSDKTGFIESGDEDNSLDAGFYIPNKIGDFVWDDLNHNGIQDEGEPGIAGAEVTLTYFDQDGNEIDTTVTTGSNGEYCFPDLVPGDYKVTFGNPTDMFPTDANIGDDATDSDADPDNMLMSEIVTLTSGDTIPTIDAGFYFEVGVGNYTFIDNNFNGIQDEGDTPLAGVTVTLYNCATGLPMVLNNDGGEVMTMVTDENGYYLFTNLPPGDYYVVFDLSTAENGHNYVTTLENQGDDSTIDSDVNADGESDKTGFLESNESDLTLDAGYYVPGKIGDFVWEDYNANGIQDEGEPGIAGVEVTLTYFAHDGTEIITTAITGSNGEYCFPDLPPGRYKVTFEQPESMSPTLTDTGDNTNDNDANPDNMLMSEIITTISGDTIPTIDGGFLALDFGDNPDSFGTTEGENGASHVIVPNKYLGLGVDAERDGNPSPMAGFDNLDGDDNAASDYTQGTVNDSDEDGIQFLTPLIPGEEACIAVSSTLAEGEAYLTAWMDFDGNGEFTTMEQIQFNVNNTPTLDAPLPLGTNTTELCFMIPADATFAGGQTFSRFRMSCEIGTQATGRVVGGEVEDYFTPLAKVGSLVWMDYNSDGIQNEPATAGTNGMTVTLTTAGPNGILGDSDDLTYTTVTMNNANGEPGYYTFCGLPEGNYQLELDPQGLISTMLNTTSEDQDADAFIQTFSVGHLADDQPTGENGMNENSGSSGFPDSHENLTFDFGFPGYDYGDLPASFATLFADNGARHIVTSDLYLGNCVDIEVNGAADQTAGEGISTGGDNNVASPLTRGTCDNENNDEDGIHFITPLIPGEEACIEVTANSPDGEAFLNAWIDFNGDGDFADDADEQIIFTKVDGTDLATATNQGLIPTGNSTQTFCFVVPTTATFDGGETHLRFRLSSAGNLTYEDMALDGEVEDYWLPLVKVGNIVWHDVNYDGLQDEAIERGINDVQIDLVTTGADGIPGTSDDITYTTYTSTMNGQDGAYMFTGLTSGIYTINVVSPDNYEPTWSEYTNSIDDDSNGSGTTFAIPDLIHSFLTTNENEAGDNPGDFNNFPDTHDDLTYDFGFVAFDYGDLPGGFPTSDADDGARHSIGSGYYLGGCVDAEEDGAPQANAGQIGEGGDDNTIGELNDGDCENPNDADGVVLLTEMIPGYEACIRVNATAPNSSAYLNAWIDFNGDGNFVDDPEEQLVFTTIDGTTLTTATDQGFIPQGQTSQVMCFQVPSDAIFDGGETHFRYRLSTQGNLGYSSFASDGEVEDYWQPLAKVGNLVWEDNNHDGSQDAEAIETGINDVEVRLITAGIDGVLGTDDDRTYTTTTANIDGIDGKYGFCGLTSGDYRIEVERPTGYYPTYADNTGNDIIDHDGEAVTFTIPDLINDFLIDSENSAGDNPGQAFNFPDGHDDLSFDFGFSFAANLACLAQVGDLNNDGDILDEFETEVDSPGIPAEFNANGIVEVEGCNMPIPDQVIRIDFGYDDQPINPLFEYDVLLNGNIVVAAAIPSRDTVIVTLLGSSLVIGDNIITVELYFNDGTIRTLEDNCEQILPVVELQTTVACNPDLNIGLGQECMAIITPDMLLEGLCDDEDTRNNYELNLTLLEPAASFMNPQNIELSGILDNGTNAVKVQVPGRYRYTANLGTLNCWGEFTLEDKTAPICRPALEEELPIAYDIDCDGVVETFVNDPSGEDDLADEYILCTLIESNGVDIYFDELELMDEVIDLDNDGEGDGNGNGIGDVQVLGDFADCTGLQSIHFEEETINVCSLTDLQGLPIDTSKYDVNAFEIATAYSRTWFAIDKNGMQSTTGCTQFVFALRPKVNTIEITPDVVIDCSEDPADLDDSTAPFFIVDNRIINNGTGSDGPTAYDTDNDEDTPSVIASAKIYPLPAGQNTCHYASSFHEDPIIPICTGSYKQVRHWTLVDWCDGQRVYDQFTQAIKVVDNTAPTLVLAGTDDEMPTIDTPEEVAMGVDTIIGTKAFDCEASGNLPLFILKDDCSSATLDNISIQRNADLFAGEEHLVIAEFNNPDGTAANGGSINELNLPKGTYTVTYSFSDDCGNAGTKEFTFGVEDTSIPNPICNDELIVSLIPTGTVGDQQARIYGEDLDDTSSDGCHPVIFEIRSNDNVNTNDDSGTLDNQWHEFVEFNCADVGNENLRVELRVTEDRNANGQVDEGELSNVCWGYVRVEDKTPPTLLVEDVNINCDDIDLTSNTIQMTLGDLQSNDPFPPTLSDGCSTQDIRIELINVDLSNFDATCNNGIIARTFRGVRTLHDNEIYSSPVTQTIKVGFVSDWTMTFPADILIECDSDIDNSDLIPAPSTIADILNNEGCDQWAMEVDDEVFDIEGQDGDGACFKVIRTYKFINWCTWDPTNTEVGIVPRPLDFFTNPQLAVRLDYQSDPVTDICALRNQLDDADDGDAYDLLQGRANATDIATLDIDDRDGDLIYLDEGFPRTNSDRPIFFDAEALTPFNLADFAFLFEGDCINEYVIEAVGQDINGDTTHDVVTPIPTNNGDRVLYVAYTPNANFNVTLANSGASAQVIGYFEYLGANANSTIQDLINLDLIDGKVNEAIGESLPNMLRNRQIDDILFENSPFSNHLIDDEQVHDFVSAEAYGYFIYRQVIKFSDSQAPIVESIDDQVILDTLGNCSALVTLCGPEVTECKSTYDTEFIVFDVNDNIISRGQFLEGATPNDCVGIGTLGYGNYRVVYTVMDGCGNNTTMEYNITILDGKAPTAYCNGGTSIDLMTTGMVEIWASDLDAGSFDDCSAPISLSFDAAGQQKNLVLTCEDIGVNQLKLYVTDAAGNQSFCETIVFVQNNDAIDCETGGLKVAGLLQTETGEAMENATVFVSGMMNESVITPATGAYEFGLTTGGDYSIFPENDVNPQNGVSTFDLVLIRKHILGVTDLDSPYKMIAADVNRSKNITTLDMLLLRKMILGITNDLDNNTSWRFVDQAFVFPDPTNPWVSEFPEVINFNNFNKNRLDANFVAVKVGDVNNSAIPNALVTNDERDNTENWSINTEELYLTTGETYLLPFYASDIGIEGYQFTLQFNTEVLEVINVQAGIATEDNFGFQRQEEGILTTSWNGQEISSTTEVLFYLTVKAKTDGRLSHNIQVSSQVITAEAYDVNGQRREVSIHFPSYAHLTPESALYQNFPNPFTEQTTIDFSLATPSNATLTVTDAAGKVLWKYQDNFTAGNQSVTVNSKDLPSAGVLFYHLATPNFSATKRMIFAK